MNPATGSHLWIERVGILLNFLAGFLLAPELIGAGRIAKAQSWIEARVRAVEQFIVGLAAAVHLLAQSLGVELGQDAKSGLRILIVMALGYWVGGAAVIYVVWPHAIARLIVIALVLSLPPLLMLLASRSGGDLLILAFGVGLPFVYATLVLFAKIANSLSGDSRLRRLLVLLGVILFIIGNGLELFATFP